MLHTIACFTLALAAAAPLPALAQVDQYGVTPQEHAACDADAAKLCSDVHEDANSLIACMKANRPRLSATCHKALTSGLRKRNLPL